MKSLDDQVLDLYYNRGWSIEKIRTQVTISTSHATRLVSKNNHLERDDNLRHELPFNYQYIQFGLKFQALRSSLGLSLGECALALRTTSKILAKCELGMFDCPISFLIRASVFFNISLGDLLND